MSRPTASSQSQQMSQHITLQVNQRDQGWLQQHIVFSMLLDIRISKYFDQMIMPD